MSAFVNKQVVRNSFKRDAPLRTEQGRCIQTAAGSSSDLVSLFKDPASQLFYAITGEPLGDIDERTADDLSLRVRGLDPHPGEHRHLPLAGRDAVEHPELPLRAAQLPEQHPAGDA